MQQQQKIIPLGKDMTWIDAFHFTKEKGGMPTNILQDDTLMNIPLWKKIKQEFSSYWGAWCREIIAYPVKHGVFAKGNIEDNSYNWYLPEKYVPKNAIGKKGIALLIDPKDIINENGTMKIIIYKVTILEKFPQTDGWYDYDKKTRFPIDETPKSDDTKRYLWRWNKQSVRPVSRYYYDFFYFRHCVSCYRHPDDFRLGVGVVEPQANSKK